MNMRNVIIEMYQDWYNNYLTIDTFAEHNGLTVEQARTLINLGMELEATPHPDA